jgi:Xaa-Pro aminopeptidase
MFEKQVYIERRNRLRQLVGNGLIFIPGNQDSPMNYRDNPYPFRQDSTFLYLFGLDQPGLFGMIDVNEGVDYLFGNDADIDDIIWMGAQPSIKELGALAGVEHTFHFNELFGKVNKCLWKGCRTHFLLPYRAKTKLLMKNLLGIHTAKLKDYVSQELINALVEMRSIKEDLEIEEMEKASETGYRMHLKAMSMAHSGNTEKQIAGILEGIAHSYGSGTSFPTILTQNGQTLHNHDHSLTLTEGRLLLVDAGAESHEHYASDFTRTFPVGGKFSQKQLDIYNIVVQANDTAASLIKPGITFLEVHLAVARVITLGLMDLGLMKGNPEDAVRSGAHALFFPHGIGHMLGLDAHDMENYGQIYVGFDKEVRPSTQFGTSSLRLGRKLQKGFVVTDEPGIYFIPALIHKWENEGVNREFIDFTKVHQYIGFGGIRLEDDILVMDKGSRLLGKRLPIYPDDIETLIQNKQEVLLM